MDATGAVDQPVQATNENGVHTLQIPEFARYVRTDARRLVITAGLEKFAQPEHKKTILAVLGGASTNPMAFHADRSWRYVLGLAEFYLWEATEDLERMLAAATVKRLRKLASALQQASALVHKAMGDDVGAELFDAWWGGPEYDPMGPYVDLVADEREFKKTVANLEALTEAAHKAANAVRTRRGRRKGTGILPFDFVEGLAAVYRDATGKIPGASGGPFAKFVCAVLDALGRYNEAEDDNMTGALKSESVVDAIKDTRVWALERRTPGKWGPSPFEKKV
jgi:hypothetical protein